MLVNALIEHVKTFNPTQIIVLTFSPVFPEIRFCGNAERKTHAMYMVHELHQV